MRNGTSRWLGLPLLARREPAGPTLRPMNMARLASYLLAVSVLVTACGGAAQQDAGDGLSPEDERLARVYAAVLPVLAAAEGGPKKRVYALTMTVPTEQGDKAGPLPEELQERAEDLSGLDIEWVRSPEDAYEPETAGLVRDGTSLLTLGTVGPGDDVSVLGVNYRGNTASRSPVMRVRKESDGTWTASVTNSGPVS